MPCKKPRTHGSSSVQGQHFLWKTYSSAWARMFLQQNVVFSRKMCSLSLQQDPFLCRWLWVSRIMNYRSSLNEHGLVQRKGRPQRRDGKATKQDKKSNEQSITSNEVSSSRTFWLSINYFVYDWVKLIEVEWNWLRLIDMKLNDSRQDEEGCRNPWIIKFHGRLGCWSVIPN